eukprot:CCRYP_015964-RC/>CCRYP_015964-RC protein AED:0.49 eAED:0.49 QI:35/1/1/1/0/0/2/3/56
MGSRQSDWQRVSFCNRLVTKIPRQTPFLYCYERKIVFGQHKKPKTEDCGRFADLLN